MPVKVDNVGQASTGAGGGVTGPGSSTDNAITRWNGTAGTAVQDSSVIVTDSGDMTMTGTLSAVRFVTTGTGSLNTVVTTGNVKGEPKHMRVAIVDPSVAWGVSTAVCLIPVLDANITVTGIFVTLDGTGADVTGDLVYASDFITKSGATVINDFDTTAGVRTDTSISTAAVSSGKAVYLVFDTQPSSDIKFMVVDTMYDYD